MDLITLLRLMLRRWPVVLPIVILTIAAGAYMVGNRTTQYRTTGVQYLATAADAGPEPLTQVVAAESLASLYDRASVRGDVAAAGLSDTFTATLSPTGAIVRLSITSETRDTALETARFLVESAPALLTETFGEGRSDTVRVNQLSEPKPSDVEAVDDGSFKLETSLVVTPVSLSRTNPFPANIVTIRSLMEMTGATELQKSVEAIDPSAEFVVSTPEFREAPIVFIEARASTPDLTKTVYETVATSIEHNLTWLQDQEQVHNDIRTELRLLVPPPEPVYAPSSLLRPMAGVVVLGGGLAIGAAVLLETAMSRRRAQRALDDKHPTPTNVARPEEATRQGLISVPPSAVDQLVEPTGSVVDSGFAANQRRR